MVIKSLKYPLDSVSVLENRSIQFKIKVAEKLLYMCLDIRNAWPHWSVFIMVQPFVI